MSERAIQSDILLALGRIQDAIFWRNNSGKLPNQHGGFTTFGLLGSPDILGCYRGRFIGVEVKTPTGRQSEQQLKFQRALERSGGLYVLARSVSDALQAIGIIT